MRIRSCVCGLIALVLCVLGSAAGAQSLDEAEVDRRLAFLEERLDASRRHGQLWQYGWLGVSGGGMVAGIVQAAHQNGDDQANSIVNAATGVIGVGYLLYDPMEARKGADPIRSMPSDTVAQKQNQLFAAEALLERNAERAEERTSLGMHAANLAFNLAAGAFVVGLGNLGDAGITAGAGAAAGALQLWSIPGRPIRDLEDYRALQRGAAIDTGLDWTIAPTPRGLAFHLRF